MSKYSFKQFLTEQEHKQGKPYWVKDGARKVYVVYDKDGKVYKEHSYPAEWDVSKRYKAAVKDVGELVLRDMEQEKHRREYEVPLTALEKEYVEKNQRFRILYQLLYKTPNLPESKKMEYEAEMERINKRLDQLTKNNVVRRSVIMGKHKDAAQ